MTARQCPYCNHTVDTTAEEVHHMEERHPLVIASRMKLAEDRDQAREPLLLVKTPITGTREEAIETVFGILSSNRRGRGSEEHKRKRQIAFDEWAMSTATDIIDALTRVRG